MNFIFLGPPGAGKGSLAVKVAQDYKIPHISTDDISRAAIKNQTELGKKVKAIIDGGGKSIRVIKCCFENLILFNLILDTKTKSL